MNKAIEEICLSKDNLKIKQKYKYAKLEMLETYFIKTFSRCYFSKIFPKGAYIQNRNRSLEKRSKLRL